MRHLLFVLALAGAFLIAHPAVGEILQTTDVVVGTNGTLQIAMPRNWTMVQTNLNFPGDPKTVELHSASNTIVIRLQIYSGAFKGTLIEPNEIKMNTIVSNDAMAYLPISVEKKIVLENLKGPAVTGSFVRFTDAGWTPVVKDEYRALTHGMFRCGQIWGTFDLLTNDKEGTFFNEGMDVIKSFRRKP